MRDKNGVEIRTGDVVRVSNAYFKNDNGLYFVAHSPDDPSWSGRDHSLTRICRNGKLSKGKYNIAFWPLSAFVNDRWKRAEADAWNREHAEIEIVSVPDKTEIIESFRKEAELAEYWIERGTYNWGEYHPEVVRNKKIRDFYLGVAERLSA